MKLKEYLKNNNYEIEIKHNHVIKNVTDNSKEVLPGDIYVYFKDNNFTHYIDEAISKGAKTIIIGNNINYSPNKKINLIKQDNPNTLFSHLLKDLYLEKYKSFPIIIGVTGTTGKTSVATIIYQMLKNFNLDVLMTSSNGNYCYYCQKEQIFKTNNTTPSLKSIYKFMSMHEMSFDYVIIEISAQGYSEGRIEKIDFDYIIMTNYSCEHLEYYKNENEYRLAKESILTKARRALIINHDIKNLFKNVNVKTISYGLLKGDYQVQIISDNLNESIFLLKCYNRQYLVNINLRGSFNILNVLAVFALFKNLGFKDDEIINKLTNIESVLGRMNIFNTNNKTIIVDYAHSLLAIEKVLLYLKEFNNGRLITVIGSGGDRDSSRRSKLGELVTSCSDLVIFTEDNSRSEKVENIINQIVSSLNNKNYLIEYDRKKAINLAFELAKQNDIIAILGKGNEDYIEKKEKYKFNDLTYVKSLIGEEDV